MPQSNRSPSPVSGNRMLWIVITLLILAFAVAVWLIPGPPPETAKVADQHMGDTAAVSQIIAKQCALGGKIEVESAVSAKLARYLTGLSSGSKVSTSDVGALIDKITPTDSGLAFYKAYTDCLKQQAAILLDQRGISLVPPSEADIEAKRDEQMRQEISRLSANVPRERLVQLLGAPVSNITKWGGGLEAEFYQYKTSIFVVDYRKDSTRVALALATKDPMQGAAIFFDQIRGMTLGEAVEQCGGFEFTGRQNARTGICPASNATNNVMKVFYGMAVTIMGKFDDPEGCNLFEAPDLKKCPGAATAPILSVLMADADLVDEADFKMAVQAFMDELDFSGAFTWRSEAEEKMIAEREAKHPDDATDAQHAAWDAQERKTRNAKMQLAVVPGP